MLRVFSTKHGPVITSPLNGRDIRGLTAPYTPLKHHSFSSLTSSLNLCPIDRIGFSVSEVSEISPPYQHTGLSRETLSLSISLTLSLSLSYSFIHSLISHPPLLTFSRVDTVVA